MDLLALLSEFGAADEALVSLAQAWADRPAADATDAEIPEGYEPLSDEDLQRLHDGLVALGEDDAAGVGLLLALADTAEAIRNEQGARDEAAQQEEAEA